MRRHYDSGLVVGRPCNKTSQNVTLRGMTTTFLSTRRARGINPKRRVLRQLPREKGCSLPEYLEAPEVNALIHAAPNP